MEKNREYLTKSNKPVFIDRLFREGETLYRYFFNRRSLNSNVDDIISPFFIIGSGRCGSTMLRAMLNTHSELAIPPESYLLGPSVKVFKKWSYLPWEMLSFYILDFFDSHEDIAELWKINLKDVYTRLKHLPKKEQTLSSIIQAIFEQYLNKYEPNAKRWGDKSLRNTFYLKELDQLTPDAQYVHILRDGRDVAASFVESGYYNNLETATDRWLVSLKYIEEFSQNKSTNSFHEIKYENLVQNTKQNLKDICEFLGIKFEQNMLEFWKHVDHLPDIGERTWYNNVKNPINDKSIGRWQNLPDKKQNLLKNKLNPKLKQYEYIN